MLTDLVWVACPLCGADAGEPFLTSPDHYGHAPGVFVVRRCQQCGLVYQNPRPAPSAFATMYPPDYIPYQPESVTPGHVPPDLERTCALIARCQPAAGRLLDVGCGPGTFLQAMRLLLPHWRTFGIEPDAAAAQFAHSQGLAVQPATLEQADFAPHSFDAVTLWNVLEHLPDPVASLRRIHHLLQPAGRLYLSLPLCDSWDARLFGRYWLGWELPRHFVLFDRASLTNLLDRTGYCITHMASLSGIEYCVGESLHIALRATLHRHTSYRLARALLFSRPLRQLVWRPYLALATRRQRTTVVTVVARPQNASSPPPFE